ncbi:MAG: c-type cytochrome [Nitrospinae bacterium]|nr:c-type cytochrome [Nitrospinota bacterium]
MKTGVSLVLFVWLAGSAWADTALLEEKGCKNCHRFSSDETQAAKGPDLFYAGDKFREEWLKEFLRVPTVIRQAGYITDPGFSSGKPEVGRPHPSLAEAESDRVAAYLMTLRLPGLETGKVDEEPLSKGTRARIKMLFERQYGCIACHKALNLVGKVRGGVSGPSLVDAGLRLKPDWIFHWLKTPKKFLAKGRMPLLDLDDEAAVHLAKYILSIRTEP